MQEILKLKFAMIQYTRCSPLRASTAQEMSRLSVVLDETLYNEVFVIY